jgi:hypothetical protein
MEWLEGSALTAWLREQYSVVVAARVLHIIGLGLLLGSSVAWDARLLGAGRNLELSALERLLLPIARLGFGLAVLSGCLMFAAQPLELSRNAVFLGKLGLIALAVGNSLVFHLYTRRNAPSSLPIHAGVSLGLWVSVAVLGRLIGFV